VLTHSERDSERLPAGPDIYTELIFWWVCHRLWSLFGGRCLCLSALSTLWWGGPCSQQGCQIQGCEICKHQRSHSWESFFLGWLRLYTGMNGLCITTWDLFWTGFGKTWW
jgi:hypothetical protein